MTLRKKYIHLLFLVGLSLHSLPVMSSEFMYRTLPVQEVADTTKDFSKMAFENPVLVITPLTACLLGGVMFKNRHRLPTTQSVSERINRVPKEIELKTIDSLLKFQNACAHGMDSCVDTMPMPVFAREGAKSGLRYVVKGIINLLPFNKKFLAVSFCFWGAGGIMPFSNVLAGFTLLAGFANGLRQDLKAKLDECTASTHTKIDESTKTLLTRIEGVSEEIEGVQLGLDNLTSTVNKGFLEAETNHKNASIQLNETQKKILDQVHREGSTVAERVTRDVNAHVDSKLLELFTQINELTKECVDLSNGVSKVGQGNAAVAQAMKELKKNLLNIREDFSSVLAGCVVKMDASTKQSTKMLEEMRSMGEAQDAKIASLITEVTNNNQLLSALSMIQSESGQALTSLQENSATNSDLLQKLFARQESSDLLFGEKMSSLHKQNEAFKTSLDISLDILSQRVGALENSQIEIKNLVIQNNLEVKLNAKNQEQQFQVNQALFQQQTQENRMLREEMSQLKELVEIKTSHIRSLECLFKKFDDRLQAVEEQVACLPMIWRNTEKLLERGSFPQYSSLQQEEQASIESGLAVSIHNFNKRSNDPQVPFNLNKSKSSHNAKRKPTQSLFHALTYDPSNS